MSDLNNMRNLMKYLRIFFIPYTVCHICTVKVIDECNYTEFMRFIMRSNEIEIVLILILFDHPIPYFFFMCTEFYFF